jgi:hypothetical protein
MCCRIRLCYGMTELLVTWWILRLVGQGLPLPQNALIQLHRPVKSCSIHSTKALTSAADVLLTHWHCRRRQQPQRRMHSLPPRHMGPRWQHPALHPLRLWLHLPHGCHMP